jgi:alanyl-tRNA synthetase
MALALLAASMSRWTTWCSLGQGADGFSRVSQHAVRGSLDELRAVAQNFTSQPKAIFMATLAEPPSVLFAVSEDSGIDAGKALKAALAEAGGRGGGNARIAQGSVPDPSHLSRAGLLAGPQPDN